MIEKFDDILKKLEKKQYEPIYFFTGEEPYYIDYLCNYIIKNALNDNEKDFNQTIFYGKEAQPALVFESALRYPMMAPYNVIVIREAQEMKKIEELAPYLEKPNTTTILVICYKYKTIDKRTKFSKLLVSNTCFYSSEKIKEHKIPSWIEGYLKERGHSITTKAAFMLTEYLGTDLGRLTGELEKLLFIHKGDGPVDVEEVEMNVGISKEYNIFELQKALGMKDIKKATKIFNYIKANPKSNPMPMLVAMLFGFFSKLYALSATRKNFNEAIKELSIPPFLIEENNRSMQIYKGKLDKVIEVLQEYDLRSKGINDPGTDETELAKEMIYRILSL